jgi:cyclopropane fatty-acyl-phospholipid synthase-like methyltransferase
VALDADAQSAAEVQQCYSGYGVEAVTASFRRLLSKKSGTGEFDLVYSTGLFDYLNQRTGRRLTASMFQMLRPGGTLLIANFLPGVRDIGYMEAFMDWNLIYRSRHDMIDLTSDIPETEVKDIQLVSEECKNIIFLALTRNG